MATRQTSKTSMPARFRKLDMTFAPTVDWDKTPTIEGTVVSIRIVPFTKKGETKNRQCMTVETEKGNVAVWASAGLTVLFQEAKVGDAVHIEFTGMDKPKPGQSAMRLFEVGIAPKEQHA